MFAIKAFFVIVLLKLCYGSKEFDGRLLSQQLFSYRTKGDVTEQAAINLDQKEIVNQLEKMSPRGRNNAYEIYRKGSNSMPYAYLRLKDPLEYDIAVDSLVIGISFIGRTIFGKLMKPAKKGSSALEVLYVKPSQKSDATDVPACQVGGSSQPLFNGCFAPEGVISFDSVATNETINYSIDYTYSLQSENKNALTMQSLSADLQDKMLKCRGCPYVDDMKYYEYYGVFDYADEWLKAAFEGRKTNFVHNGHSDFSIYGEEGLAEIIKKGTVQMGVWMQVIYEMERALDACNMLCTKKGCNEESLNAWDSAVAFYTGQDTGYLLYSLAKDMCSSFGTCSDIGSHGEKGMARVNLKIMSAFALGQERIYNGACDLARRDKEIIVQLMAVPLVQGTIRNAHISDIQNDVYTLTEKTNAEGAAFAAAVLPLVNSCSPKDAEIIYNNMRVGRENVIFGDVKAAFERNYDCMGIQCAEVGGLVDDSHKGYFTGASPCKSHFADAQFYLITSGLVAILLISLVMVYVTNVKLKPKSSKSEERVPNLSDFHDYPTFEESPVSIPELS